MTEPSYRVLIGDCREQMRTLPAGSVHCCVTSPPYWALRSYLPDGHQDKHLERGLEKTPDEYIASMVAVFAEVWRVLRDDGTLWLNIGDSYASNPASGGKQSPLMTGGEHKRTPCIEYNRPEGLKPKDLVGIPWRLAFALQAAGWYLRQEIIWHKPAPMPESVRDRCTKAHEQIFLLTKRPRYFFDAEAVKERGSGRIPGNKKPERADASRGNESSRLLVAQQRPQVSRNRRSVWTINTEAFRGSHFATFPSKLVEPCILAGTSAHGCCAECGGPWVRVVEKGEMVKQKFGIQTKFADSRQSTGGLSSGMVNTYLTTGWQPSCQCNAPVIPCTVLDPFGGSGTTAGVAMYHRRNAILCELNPEYAAMVPDRVDYVIRRMRKRAEKRAAKKQLKPLPTQRSLFCD